MHGRTIKAMESMTSDGQKGIWRVWNGNTWQTHIDRHVYVYTLSIQDWSEHCKKAYRVQQEQQHKQQTHTYRIQWPSEIWNTSMFVNLSCLRMKIYFHSSHEPVSPAQTHTHRHTWPFWVITSLHLPYTVHISLSGRGKRRFGPCVLATAVDTNL